MTATTAYVLRTAGPAPSYLHFLDGGSYGFTGRRPNARRYVGRKQALAAALALEAVLAENGRPNVKVEVVPARGGTAVSR